MTAGMVASSFEAGSWLHRMSPIPKLAWAAAGFAVALVTFDPLPLVLISCIAAVAAATAGVLRRLGRALIPFAPLASSILLIQLLVPAVCWPDCRPLATLGPLTLYGDGIGYGLSLVARLLAMQTVVFTVALTTTSPDLFAGLDRLRVPRPISFAAAMTLQLVPILRREVSIVLGAQRARGLRVAGPRALACALVPVMVASVERVEQMTISLESRGFGGRARRTSVREVGFGIGDRVLAVAGITAGIAGVAAGLTLWGRATAPVVTVDPGVAIAVAAIALLVLVAGLARAVVLVLRA
jgi:energy-coupling factor transport system permease protein